MRRMRCACGWEVTGEEDEVVRATQEHGQRLHNMRATREQVLERLEMLDGPPGAGHHVSPRKE